MLRSPLLLLLFLLFAPSFTFAQELKTINIRHAGETSVFFRWSPDRIPMISAHRGGPAPGFPENCIETFENTISHTHAIIETDILMTKDGQLIMMHDNTLDRTTSGAGRVDQVSMEYISSLKLKDNDGQLTDFKVPTLTEVLHWGKGRVVFTLDVKRGVPFDKVVKEVIEAGATHYSVIITYNMDDAKLVHRLNSDLMISISLGSMEAIEQWKKSGIPAENVVAFVGTSERDQAIYEILHKEGIYCILGTMGNLDRSAAANGDDLYKRLIQNGADILSTDRPIEASKALESLIDKNSRRYQRFFSN
jgi:glycerophosphoryl diester phosphodiesterase